MAAVFAGPQTPLRIEPRPLPEPGPGEVIVRVRMATICGSDLHTFSGRRPGNAPCVPGHEMTGDVERLHASGARDFLGRPLQEGDRITWSMLWSCGACYYCWRGLRAKCERLRKFGHDDSRSGQGPFGGYARHCHLPAGTAIFKIPAHVSDRAAAPANCATATVAAAMRAAGPVEGRSVVVRGAGMLGLTACAIASAAGASAVLAIDIDPARLRLASRFGAMVTADGSLPDSEIERIIRRATGERGADIAFDFVGTAESCETLPALLRPGGHAVLAGAVFPSRPMAISAEQLVRRMLKLSGVHNYEPSDLERALGFLAGDGCRFPFEDLVDAVFPLERINEAIAHAETVRPPRVGLQPNQE